MSAPTIVKGRTWIPGETVTPARLNDTVDAATLNFTKTDVIAGRATAGAGVAEEIDCTAAGRALLDDVSAFVQRATLGLSYLGANPSDYVTPITLGGTGAAGPGPGRAALNMGVWAPPEEATIVTNVTLSSVFELLLTGNRTLGQPSALNAGAKWIWIIKQDATGGRTLAYAACFKFPGGVTPTLSTAANAVDVLTGVCLDSEIYCELVKAFA